MQDEQPKGFTNREFIQFVLEKLKAEAKNEPLPCDVVEVNGKLCLRVEIDYGPGTIIVEVTPDKMIEWAALQAFSLHAQLDRESPGFTPALKTGAVLNDFANKAAGLWILGLKAELRAMLAQHDLQILCVLKGAAIKAAGMKGGGGNVLEPRRLTRDLAHVRKQWLDGLIDHYSQRDFSPMQTHFDELLSLAKEAKQVFRQNKGRNWYGMIAEGFPDFDSDVVYLFGDGSENSELPAVIVENFTTPADIALLQAARRCGMRGFECTSPRTLRDWMKKGAAVKTDGATASPDRPETVKTYRAASSLKEAKTLKWRRARRTQNKLVSAKVH